jgi:hypothetical protein
MSIRSAYQALLLSKRSNTDPMASASLQQSPKIQNLGGDSIPVYKLASGNERDSTK